jgi:ubiquinone/menaquinone biosynthesis C-methylase UbiE
MIPRILEPEVMDTSEEATDYDSMDHDEVNRLFVAELLAAEPNDGPILDLGAGTGLIPIELCRQSATARIVAVDAARHMLDVAAENVRREHLEDRIDLQLVDAKSLPYADGAFATVMSNSIIHHIAEPSHVLREAWRVAAPAGLLFFRDLCRPDNDREVARLVESYPGETNNHQRQMFEDSLRAALTVEEMQALVGRLGADPSGVTRTSDRHWTWVACKPATA